VSRSGFDASERVRGRKRQLLVDTGGLLLRAVVYSAGVQDRAGAERVLPGVHLLLSLLALTWVLGGTSTASMLGPSAGSGAPKILRSWP
jgi:hypothetical protein